MIKKKLILSESFRNGSHLNHTGRIFKTVYVESRP